MGSTCAKTSKKGNELELVELASVKGSFDKELNAIPNKSYNYSEEKGFSEITIHDNEKIKGKRINPKTGKPYKIVKDGIPLRIAEAIKAAAEKDEGIEIR